MHAGLESAVAERSHSARAVAERSHSARAVAERSRSSVRAIAERSRRWPPVLWPNVPSDFGVKSSAPRSCSAFVAALASLAEARGGRGGGGFGRSAARGLFRSSKSGTKRGDFYF